MESDDAGVNRLSRQTSGRSDGRTNRDSMASEGDAVPIHPIPSMQEAFDESIQEANRDNEEKRMTMFMDAKGRRNQLLNQTNWDSSWTTRWKQRPSAKCHPITKLMSQIIFGLHLLQQRQAKSDSEVVKILQTHVDEIDAFMEKTGEDFDVTLKDIEERITFLKLPMTHRVVFDRMLDDKAFRTQLMDGNDKIEKIIVRTARAMNAALLDILEAVSSTEQLAHYLSVTREEWPQAQASSDQSAIFVAMRGNEQGWRRCLKELQEKERNLSRALIRLGTLVSEMSKLAGAASRKNMGQPSHSQPPMASRAVKRDSPRMASPPTPEQMNKPLPKMPGPSAAASRPTMPRASASMPVLTRTPSKIRKAPPAPLLHPSQMFGKVEKPTITNQIREAPNQSTTNAKAPSRPVLALQTSRSSLFRPAVQSQNSQSRPNFSKIRPPSEPKPLARSVTQPQPRATPRPALQPRTMSKPQSRLEASIDADDDITDDESESLVGADRPPDARQPSEVALYPHPLTVKAPVGKQPPPPESIAPQSIVVFDPRQLNDTPQSTPRFAGTELESPARSFLDRAHPFQDPRPSTGASSLDSASKVDSAYSLAVGSHAKKPSDASSKTSSTPSGVPSRLALFPETRTAPPLFRSLTGPEAPSRLQTVTTIQTGYPEKQGAFVRLFKRKGKEQAF